jgi:hypothetical protein
MNAVLPTLEFSMSVIWQNKDFLSTQRALDMDHKMWTGADV